MKMVIGSISFDSKEAVKEYVRSLVNRSMGKKRIHSDNHPFLLDLIDRHPEREEKIGKGIVGFSIRQNTCWRNNFHFVIHRKDGTSTDFSWLKCLGRREQTVRAEAVQAFRKAVQAQVLACKLTYWGGDCSARPCPISGLPMVFRTSSVDHDPEPFFSILERFLKTKGVDIETIALTKTRDNDYGKDFEDKNLKQDWMDFHEREAKLRVISTKENLKKGVGDWI